jgi:N-acetyl-anhydromuramyl-L-alanine amidase AmpD
MIIDTTSYRARAVESRVQFLVLHYTVGNFALSVAELTGPRVSVHYVVPDPTDLSYRDAGFTGVRVFGLTDEQSLAHHAGVSSWRGRSNLNDTSIGIEIVNTAHDGQGGEIIFVPYNPEQIKTVKALAADILQRYPAIVPVNVVGHSDIAPTRKSDPGPLFPWQELYAAGIGAWYDEPAKARYAQQYSLSGVDPRDVVHKLGRYGYDVSAATDAAGIRAVLRAFQMHFRPSKYDGVLDVETAAILAALVEKYCPEVAAC